MKTEEPHNAHSRVLQTLYGRSYFTRKLSLADITKYSPQQVRQELVIESLREALSKYD